MEMREQLHEAAPAKQQTVFGQKTGKNGDPSSGPNAAKKSLSAFSGNRTAVEVLSFT
jgi:hypothetical protein